jgi:hypothetical protein
MKSSRNDRFENCNSIGDGSDMDFGPCSYDLCTILKKEVGKVVEKRYFENCNFNNMGVGTDMYRIFNSCTFHRYTPKLPNVALHLI